MSNFPKKIYSKEQLGGVAVNLLRYTLTAGISASATTFPVTPNPTTRLPDPSGDIPVYMRIGTPGIDEEIVKVYSRDATNIYATRNADGKGAYLHNLSDYVVYTPSAELWNLLCDVVADIEGELIASAICAEDIEAYKWVTYNSNWQMIKSKANVLATSYVIGMTVDGFESGATGYALRSGIIQNANWNFSSISKLWLSATIAGEFQTTSPEYGNYESINGLVIASNKIDFRPNYTSVAQL